MPVLLAFALHLLLSGLAFAQGGASASPVPVQPDHGLRVETFGECRSRACPAVIVLGGSRGLKAAAYRHLADTLNGSGAVAYLAHVLSATDLDTMANVRTAAERIRYYDARMGLWTAGVRALIDRLDTQGEHSGRVGILGVSLGAQVAAAAAVVSGNVRAVVLVDGGPPLGFPRSATPPPPMLLLWGGKDKVFPPSVAHQLLRNAKEAGGAATMEVFQSGGHAFFIEDGAMAMAAHRKAVKFLIEALATQ